MTRQGLFESNRRKKLKIENNCTHYEALKKEQKILYKQRGIMSDEEYFKECTLMQEKLYRKRYSSPTRLVRICKITGRSRDVRRFFGLCGAQVREHMENINGFYKQN
jgi:ribosomal protein S14